MKKNMYIQELAELYEQSRIVPFIGAGLSMPFNIPSWNSIIKELMKKVGEEYHPAINFELKQHNYWEAVDLLMRFGNLIEYDVQQEICAIIQSSIHRDISIETHNYADLGRLAFKTFVTTNYDGLLYEFLEGNSHLPVNLADVQINSQKLINNTDFKRIWCLHGQLSNPGSIVLTRKKYDLLYRNNNYIELFSLLKASNTFLFLGFSFDDQYLKKLINVNKDIFNNVHYIVLNKPTIQNIKHLREHYNLKVIPIEVNENIDYASEIREILKQISFKEVQKENKKKDISDINLSKKIESIWNVPYKKNIFFMGRKAELEHLERAVYSNKGTSFIQAISGLGGIGKTQLALQYCYQKRNQYDVIHWINAENNASIIASYEKLASTLHLPLSDEKNNNVTLEVVKKWMQTNSNWLIVFDNLMEEETLQTFLPTLFCGDIIITTRKSNISSLINPMDLDKFKRSESIQFILNRIQKHKCFEGSADQLADTLDDLPLALEQASAYIIKTGISIDDYLKRFKKYRQQIIREGMPLDYNFTIATTWEMSFEEIKKKNPKALDFIYLCSVLSPDKIELEIFKNHNDDILDILSNWIPSELELDQILATLREFSLIKSHESSFSIHRLVQVVINDKLDIYQRKYFIDIGLNLLLDNWENLKNKDSKISHTLTITKYAIDNEICLDEVTKILNLLSGLLISLGQFNKAMEILYTALKIDSILYSELHFSVARDYNSLGVLYTNLGDYNKAEAYFKKSINIDTFNKGNRVDFSHNLATLKWKQGFLYEAAEIYEETIKRIEFYNLIQEDIMVSAIFISFGSLLNEIGEYEKAKQYLMNIIKLLKTHVGVKTSSLLIRAYNNLSLLHESLGEYEEAITTIHRAIKLVEQYVGKNSFEIIECYNNLGLYYYKMYEASQFTAKLDTNKLILSKKYLNRSLSISRKLLGENHILQTDILNNLAMTYEALGDYNLAKTMLLEGLSICKEHLGNVSHPKIATIESNLGSITWKLGDYKKGEELLLNVLKNDVLTYGKNNVEIARDYRKLSDMYYSNRDYDKAIKSLKKSHKIYKSTIGDDKYETLLTQLQIYFMLLDNACYKEAKNLSAKVLKSALHQYGEGSPIVEHIKLTIAKLK